MIFFNLLFLLLAEFIPNFFYKGRSFIGISWRYVFFLSGLFIAFALGLLSFSQPFLLVNSNIFQLVSFVVISISWFIWPQIITQIGKKPKEYIAQNPIRFLVRFELKTYLIKYFEILHQQAAFIFILFVLLNSFAYSQRILLFTLLVGLIHIGNYLVMPRFWATFYFVLSIPMAAVFSFLMLNGWVFITISLHLLFYILHNSYYWLAQSKRK